MTIIVLLLCSRAGQSRWRSHGGHEACRSGARAAAVPDSADARCTSALVRVHARILSTGQPPLESRAENFNGLPEPPTPLPAARPAVPAVTPGPRSVGLDRQGAHRAGHPAERGRPSPSPAPLPRQRPVVLLDELAELGRHLVRAGEEELLLAAALEGAA